MASLTTQSLFPYFPPPSPTATPPFPTTPPPAPSTPSKPPPYFTPPPPHTVPSPPHSIPPPSHNIPPSMPPHFVPPPSHVVPPPPPHNVTPPMPPHSVPPPSHMVPPPMPPHHVSPPPHVVPPPPPSPGNHSAVIVVVFVSCGGVFFLAFLMAALWCFLKKRKKMVRKAENVHFDEHRHVTERIVQGPHGTESTVLSVEDDIHIEEDIEKSQLENLRKGLHLNPTDTYVGGPTDPRKPLSGSGHHHLHG